MGGLFPNKVSMVKLMNLTKYFLMRWDGSCSPLYGLKWTRPGCIKMIRQVFTHSILLSSYSPKWFVLFASLHIFCVFFFFFLAQRAIQSKTKPGQSIDYIRNTTALIFSPQVTEEIFQEWGDLKHGEEWGYSRWEVLAVSSEDLH